MWRCCNSRLSSQARRRSASWTSMIPGTAPNRFLTSASIRRGSRPGTPDGKKRPAFNFESTPAHDCPWPAQCQDSRAAMDAKGGKRPRRYRLKARAERQDENRRKIVEAAYRLHMTVGPSRTTTSAIARLSGVERPTVRRHFPDFLSLFMACSLHGMTLDPPPDASAWTQVTDPAERLRRALTELYESYRRNRTVFADMDNFRDEPGLEGLWAMMNQRTDWQR